MNFKDKIFVNPANQIKDCDIIFVSDLFVEDYTGGAELTSEALIETSPYKIQKIRSKDLNLSILQQGADKFWIFGNFAQINFELIPTIVANLKYSILEYDYKFCRFRSPEKHLTETGSACDCDNQMSGKIVSAFYHGSKVMWWMSEKQKERYLSLFPFLREKDNIVLSSVFSRKTLGLFQTLRERVSQEDKKGWIVLGSQSWVKGFDAAKKWCEKNGKDHEVVWNVPYEQLLAKLASAEGFVYLPSGADTCPRMVIEAKLLGCKLHINDNVQHKDEEWFNTEDLGSIQDYLYASPDVFWKAIRIIMEKKTTISGYTTTYNCEKQGYPYLKSIKSMLQFCDEVCIVDGGSTDGTWERLIDLVMEPKGIKLSDLSQVERERTIELSKFGAIGERSDGKKIQIKQIARDWNHPRFAVFDGMQKAEARAMCQSEFCWQMDSDEIVHEEDAPKIIDLVLKMPSNVEIVSLPVVEFWGGPEKIRLDIQPWKWRLSRNLPHITHGIPCNLRKFDINGIYALPGTDGCDMIHAKTGESLPHLTFHTQETENIRKHALMNNKEALKIYSEWFNKIIINLPGVYHYSWYDLPRKIRTYRDYWTKHWNSLTNNDMKDSAESNMMFDVPWSEVTDEMIHARAEELKEKCGGWIWHSKWRGERTPHLTIDRKEPNI